MNSHRTESYHGAGIAGAIEGSAAPDHEETSLVQLLEAIRSELLTCKSWDEEKQARLLASPRTARAIDLGRFVITEQVRCEPASSTDDALVLIALLLQTESLQLPPSWARFLQLLEPARHPAVKLAMRSLLQALSRKHGPLFGPLLIDTMSEVFASPESTSLQMAIEALIEIGEKPVFDLENDLPNDLACMNMRLVFSKIETGWAGEILAQLADLFPGTVDAELIEQIGVVISPADAGSLADRRQTGLVDARSIANAVETLLDGEPPSAIISSASSVLLNRARDQVHAELVARKWTVLDLSYIKLMAGSMFIGVLEERLQAIREQSEPPNRLVVSVQDLSSLIWAGAHSKNPLGVLDTLSEDISRGRIRLLGACRNSDLSRLRSKRSDIFNLFTHVPLREHDEDRVIAELAEEHGVETGIPRELWNLSRKYRSTAPPLDIVSSCLTTHQRLRRVDPQPPDLTIEAFCQTTGLEKRYITRQPLPSTDHYEQALSQNVLGQPGAIEAVADILERAHAGLSCNSRPLGVMLFTGPTGTGKTYMAQCMSRTFFGHDQPPVILDMSEFSHEHDTRRLLLDEDQADSLCRRVMDRPCSVLLLDEVEKAHPAVLKLFLQVFDAGRLNTLRGKVVDFRNTIIVMTSNLGVARHGISVTGFAPETRTGRPAYRHLGPDDLPLPPEFLNRIDAIVHFQELPEDVCRRILTVEIHRALARGPLIPMADRITVDASIEDLLLERGFTPRYGARALKRAIDSYLITPIARALNTGAILADSEVIHLTASDGDIVVQTRTGAASG